jgi:hypothetical protein
VQIEKKIVAVFSAFFSHVCMLDKDQWTVVHVPTDHVKSDSASVTEAMAELSVEPKDTIAVFVDPITMRVFEGCTWHFFAGERNDISVMRAYVNEDDARTAWYDIGTRYGAAMGKLKRSVTPGKEPPHKKTEVSKPSTKSEETRECHLSKVSPLSSETEVEA